MVTGLFLISLAACGPLTGREKTGSKTVSHRERFNKAYRLVLRGRYDTARKRFRPIAESADPRNEYRDDAAFWLGYCFQELGDRYDAVRWYERLVADHPESPYLPAARKRLERLNAPALTP